MRLEGQTTGIRRLFAKVGRVLFGRDRGPIEGESERAAAYRLLGLEPGADPHRVRQAFRKLAAAHHPDRYRVVASSERAAIHRRFTEITAAYHAIDA